MPTIELSSGRNGRFHGISERIGRTLFGVILAMFGTLFLLGTYGGASAEREAASWTETPCTVIESYAESAGDGNWTVRVRYRYEAGGRTLESGNWSWNGDPCEVEGVAERDRMLERYAAGAAATCLTDPADPVRACLLRPSRTGPVIAAAVPLFCLALGLGMAVSAWMPNRSRRGRRGDGEGTAATFAVVAGVLFFSAGAFLCAKAMESRREAQRARTWTAVPATVVRSEVASRWVSGSGGHAGHYVYRPYIVYSYDAGDGVLREGDRFAFSEGGESRRLASASAMVAANPAGSRVTVWADPENPAESVFSDPSGGPGAATLLPVLFSGLFAAFGAGAVFAGLGIAGSGSRARRGAGGRPSRRDPELRRGDGSLRGSVLKTHRFGTFAGYAMFAVMWYSILGAVALGFFSDRDPGAIRPDEWPPLGIAGVLALAGLVPAGAAVRALLAMFAPRLVLETPGGALERGTTETLSYRMKGDAAAVSGISVSLVCVSKRAVRGGSRQTHVVENECWRSEVFRTERAADLAGGRFDVAVPASPPPSSSGTGTRIEWRFEVELLRRGRSPVRDRYGATVA